MLMQCELATLLVVDIQDKLLPAIPDSAALLKRAAWLIGSAVDTGLPVVFSEQYPRGLGGTNAGLLALAPMAPVVEKMHFSCVAAQCLPEELSSKPQVIVCGMESHVCVMQTVLQLLDTGKTVFVVADVLGSRRQQDHDMALARMQAAGAVIVTREMVLFEMLGKAGTEHFKTLSKRYLQGEQPH